MSLTFAGARVTVETGTAMREQARVRMLSERRSGRTYSRPTEDPQRSGRTRHLSFTASSDVVGWGSVWDVIEDDVPPKYASETPREGRVGHDNNNNTIALEVGLVAQCTVMRSCGPRGVVPGVDKVRRSVPLMVIWNVMHACKLADSLRESPRPHSQPLTRIERARSSSESCLGARRARALCVSQQQQVRAVWS